jgi:hypothetical protein
VDQVAVHSLVTKDHEYVICRDLDDGLFFLMVDGQPYLEDQCLFKGTFCDVLKRMEEIRATEGLKTMT